MKKIKYLATALILSLTMVTSCTDDGGTSNQNFITGGAPNVQKTAGTEQSLNFDALSTGGSIKIGVTLSVARGDIASMNVVGYYYKGAAVEKGILTTGLTTFPTSVTYTEADLYKAFSFLTSPSDFSIADKLKISADITLKDGTVLSMFDDKGVPLYGADIANSLQFSVAQTYIMSCPILNASPFDGDYKIVKDDWADYVPGEIIPVVYDEAFGQFKFKILNTNNPYQVNAATSYLIVTVDPETAKATAVGNEPFDYGGGQTFVATATGSVSACTGEITLKVDYSGNGPYSFVIARK